MKTTHTKGLNAAQRMLERTFNPRARKRLIKARQRLGLTRPMLAEMIGVDRTVIFKVEVGIQGTSMDTMCRWVEALGPRANLNLFKPTYPVEPRKKGRPRGKSVHDAACEPAA